MPPHARVHTIELVAASVPLAPDAARLDAALSVPALDWNDALYLADGHGITPLLYRLWGAHGLIDRLPPEIQTRLAQAYRDNATRNADARREFRELAAMMQEIRVETIVLKGLPLLDQLYADPAERVLYDFDLLARDRAEAQRGLNALIAAGFTPVPSKSGARVEKHLPSVWRRNGFVRRGYLFDVAQPRPVEMHVGLWDSPWRGLNLAPLPNLWQHSRRVDVNGMSVRVLSPEDTLIHLCVHLATHLVEREARAGQAIDIGRFLSAFGSELDWARLLESAERAHATRFVYLALRAAAALTNAPLPSPEILDTLRSRTPTRLREWAEKHSARDLLAMDFRHTDLSRAYDLTFASAQSLYEKINVVKFALLPPLDALQAEYGGRGAWLFARHFQKRGGAYLAALRQRRTNGH